MVVQQSMPPLSDIRAELRSSPKLMTYLKAGRILKGVGGAPRRIRFVSSFTTRGLEPYLRAEAALSGWSIEPEFHEYGLWQQALLGDSTDPAPDAFVLLLHIEEFGCIDRNRLATLEAAKSGISSVLRGFRDRTDVPIVIPFFPEAKSPSALGFGRGGLLPETLFAREMNDMLREIAVSIPSVYVVEVSPGMESFPDGLDQVGLYSTLSPISARQAPHFSELIARALSGFFRPRKKVLITDLDNTLWGGVVGELGASGVALGPDWPGQSHKLLQRAMLDLSETGVLLAINSKNNEADAREVFDSRREMVLRWDDFAAKRINWTDKAENIASMAKELSLGVDSFVFIDDSPVECARVREALPGVEVIHLPEDPTRYVEALLDCRGFDTLTISAEDRNRAESYRAEGKRREVLETVGMDLSDFLKSLDLSIRIVPLADRAVSQDVLDRAQQLFQKTNQFHLTLDRLTPAEVALRRDNLFVVSLSDKFGDYGIIGVFESVPVEHSQELQNFALSCRALGRHVEESIVGFLAEQARHRGVCSISALFREGSRNKPALTFLRDSGFVPRSENLDGDAMLYELPVSSASPVYPTDVKIEKPNPGDES